MNAAAPVTASPGPPPLASPRHDGTRRGAVITYWVPPFIAIQMVHWIRHHSHLDLTHLLDLQRLGPGWDALIVMVVGFGAAVPFMNTTLVVGSATSSCS